MTQSNSTVGSFTFNASDIIGTGQFGSVYKGYDLTTNEVVAIKEIPEKRLTTDYHKHLFRNEIQSLRKLQSPYIVKLLDLKNKYNNIYVITEYCEGGDLESYIEKHGRLNDEEVSAVLTQIVEGYKEMKRHNLMHRDLKPANVLLKNGRIKICDLGFSKMVDNYQYSLTKSYVGSPIYMSPQVLFKESYTSKADVWSLGILIYQLIYGQVPWDAIDIVQLAKQIQGRIDFKPQVPISLELKDLITRCLKYNERDRINWDEVFSHPAVLKKQIRAPCSPQANQSPANLPMATRQPSMTQPQIQQIQPQVHTQGTPTTTSVGGEGGNENTQSYRGGDQSPSRTTPLVNANVNRSSSPAKHPFQTPNIVHPYQFAKQNNGTPKTATPTEREAPYSRQPVHMTNTPASAKTVQRSPSMPRQMFQGPNTPTVGFHQGGPQPQNPTGSVDGLYSSFGRVQNTMRPQGPAFPPSMKYPFFMGAQGLMGGAAFMPTTLYGFR